MNTFDAKERIRQEIDIVDLIGSELPLRRQGRNFVATCPWHDDSRPSLQVNQQRQSWKCWVCDIGGDVFSFVMKRENVEFPEAVRMLAERAGVEIQSTQRRPTKAGDPNDKQTLYKACDWAVDRFHQFLSKSPHAESARTYLRERNINETSIARYRIGFSPSDWQWILNQATGTEFSPLVLEAIGLIFKSQKNGKYCDRFRCRVLFPISDPQRRAIGVGGRILPEFQDERAAKYINSPETMLYSKSDQLYGLDVARDTEAVKKDREIIVTEGYTDVVVCNQFGVGNIVAVCGTSLTERHIRLLKRYADRITLVLDGDDAGKKKANSVLELFVASQVDLRIVTLPDGLDPCDFVLQHGTDLFRELIANAPDALDHKIQNSMTGFDPVRDTHQSNTVLQELLATMAKSPRIQEGGAPENRLREQQILAKLSRDFRVDEAHLRSQLFELRRTARTKTRQEPSQNEIPNRKLRLTSVERDVFELLIRHPEASPAVLEKIGMDALETPTAKTLLAKFAALEAEGVMADFARLTLEFDSPEMKSLLVELDEQSQAKDNFDSELILRDLLDLFERKQLEADLRNQQASLETDSGLEEVQQLKMLNDLIVKRQQTQK